MQNLQVELRDRDGRELSGRAYIQSVLSEIDRSANASVSSRFNKFFSSLDSFALPFPTSDFKDAKRLSAMAESEFTAEYRQEKARLRARVAALLQPKRLGRNVLGGAMLAQLLSSWTENVNVQQPAARQSSASALMRSINEREVGRAVARYKAEMRPVSLPLPDAELRRLHDAAVRAAVSGLRLEDLPDFSSLFELETNGLYAQYLKLSEQQLRAQLEARAAFALQDWRERVAELRKRLPLEPAALLQAEEAAKAKWREDVAALRSVGPALSTDFDRQVSGSLETERALLVLDSLAAFKQRHKQQAETVVAALPLPSEEEQATRLESEQLSAWAALASTFSSLLSAAELEPHTAEMRSFLSSKLGEWKARNAEESARLCGLEAVRLSRQLMRDSEERWTDSPHLASLSGLRSHMQRLQQSPLCVGPGRSHEAVAYQLSKAQRAVAEQIQQRTTLTQLAYGAAALLALRLLLVCRRLAAGGSDGSRGYELLGAAEGKDTRREAAGCAAIGLADRLLLLTALPLAAALHWSGSHVPDASAGYWQLALWGSAAALVTAALLSGALTAGRALRCCRGGKSSHEH